VDRDRTHTRSVRRASPTTLFLRGSSPGR